MKITRGAPSTVVEVAIRPSTGGSIRMAPRTVERSTGRSKAMAIAVSAATRLPTGSVAATTAVDTPRVRKDERAGVVVGRPVCPRAPAWTVTVW